MVVNTGYRHGNGALAIIKMEFTISIIKPTCINDQIAGSFSLDDLVSHVNHLSTKRSNVSLGFRCTRYKYSVGSSPGCDKCHHLNVDEDFSTGSILTLPSRPTLATLIVGGLFISDTLPSVGFESLSLFAFFSDARAGCRAPAGASAISFKSRMLSTSLSSPPRVCKRIVVGP